MKILILGSNGMLGHMVKLYLSKFHDIEIIKDRWPSKYFKDQILENKASVLINCIGAIPQKTNKYQVNWELPIWLDENFKGRIIHPSTDCEMDEDDYGISKRKAAEWLLKNAKRTKIIKTSIIGPELNGHASFLNWFLSNKDGTSINGYSNHMWNGITTLSWAKFSKSLIENWTIYPIRTVLSSQCISKYELCVICNTVFDRKILINPFRTEKSFNKCLVPDIELDNIEIQLKELRKFYVQKI